MKDWVKLGILNSISYFVLTINFRAVAQANYLATFLSDVLCGVLAFTIVKKISVSDRKRDVAAYSIGGAAGAMAGIYLTKQVFGQ